MGDVYLCLDKKLNRHVAVKLIKPEHANRPEYRERFQREIDSAIALEGYDVVRINDYGECSLLHAPYYVMEYLRGRDVRQELCARGSLELLRALEILVDVCKVIDAAHARGIVHRDLKPSNLFLEGPPSPRKSVRVLDFGIARVLGDPRDGALTQLSGQPGSPNYMSPEQHKNELQVGIQADIWALGAVLYEMVIGEKAWPGESYEARQRVLEDATPSVRTSRPELPSELDRIIQKCLEKEPAARYSSVADLARDLHELQSEQQASSKTLPTFVGSAQPRTWRSYRPAWALALAALSTLIVVLIALRPWWPQASSSTSHITPSNAPAQRALRQANEVAWLPSVSAPLAHPPSTGAPVRPASALIADTSLPPRAKPASSGDPAKKASRMRQGIAATPAPAHTSPALSPASAPKLSRNETRLKRSE
jgi:serine/threonine-protein kinase